MDTSSSDSLKFEQDEAVAVLRNAVELDACEVTWIFASIVFPNSAWQAPRRFLAQCCLAE
jgi:hypothetical protein